MLTVTRLEPQKKNPQRLNVYLEGEFAFGISRAAAPWLEEGHLDGKVVRNSQIGVLYNNDVRIYQLSPKE